VEIGIEITADSGPGILHELSGVMARYNGEPIPDLPARYATLATCKLGGKVRSCIPGTLRYLLG
jgi:hypothetical protein